MFIEKAKLFTRMLHEKDEAVRRGITTKCASLTQEQSGRPYLRCTPWRPS